MDNNKPAAQTEAETPLIDRLSQTTAEILRRRGERSYALAQTLNEKCVAASNARVAEALAAAGVDLGAEGDPDWLLAARPSLPTAYASPVLFPLVQELARRHGSDREKRELFFFGLHEASVYVRSGESGRHGQREPRNAPSDVDDAIKSLWPKWAEGESADEALAHAQTLFDLFQNPLAAPATLRMEFDALPAWAGDKELVAKKAIRPGQMAEIRLGSYSAWVLSLSGCGPEGVSQALERTAELCRSALADAIESEGFASVAEAYERLARDAETPGEEDAALLAALLAMPAAVEERLPGKESVLRFPLIDEAVRAARLAQKREQEWAAQQRGMGGGLFRESLFARKHERRDHGPKSDFVRGVENFLEARADSPRAGRARAAAEPSLGLFFRDGRWQLFFGDAPKIGAQFPRAMSQKAERLATSLLSAQHEFLGHLAVAAPPRARTQPEEDQGLPGEFLCALVERLARDATTLSGGSSRGVRLRQAMREIRIAAAPIDKERAEFWSGVLSSLPIYAQIGISACPQWMPHLDEALVEEPIDRHGVERIGRPALLSPEALRPFVRADRRVDSRWRRARLDRPNDAPTGRTPIASPWWLSVGRAPDLAEAMAAGSPTARLALARDLNAGELGERSEQRLLVELRADGLSEPGWRLLTKFEGKSEAMDAIAHAVATQSWGRGTRSDRKTLLANAIDLLNACADANVEPQKAQALMETTAILQTAIGAHCAMPMGVIKLAQPTSLDEAEKAAAAAKRNTPIRTPAQAKELDDRLRETKAARVARLAAQREADAPARRQLTRALADFAFASFAEIESLPPDPAPAPATGPFVAPVADAPRPLRLQARVRLRDAINDLADWMANSPEERADLPKKFGVSALFRRAEAWHERLAIQKAEENVEQARSRALQGAQIALRQGDAASEADIRLLADEGKWPSAIERVEDAPESESPAWSAVGLCSEVELLGEGAAMRHCVGSYASTCAKGSSRIFSLRDEQGRRLATLELQPKKDKDAIRWPIAQLRGVGNSTVEDPRALALAQLVSQRYAEAALLNREKIAKNEAAKAAAAELSGKIIAGAGEAATAGKRARRAPGGRRA